MGSFNPCQEGAGCSPLSRQGEGWESQLPPLPHPADPHVYKHVRTVVKKIDFTPRNVPTGLSPDNSRPTFMTEFPGCMWFCEATDGS